MTRDYRTIAETMLNLGDPFYTDKMLDEAERLLREWDQGCCAQWEVYGTPSFIDIEAGCCKQTGPIAWRFAHTYRPVEAENKCTCHERDSSQVCEYCYAQGYRGHMQGDPP